MILTPLIIEIQGRERKRIEVIIYRTTYIFGSFPESLQITLNLSLSLMYIPYTGFLCDLFAYFVDGHRLCKSKEVGRCLFGRSSEIEEIEEKQKRTLEAAF